MPRKNLISIVIPTYNERENIEILIPKIFRVLEKEGVEGEVIIVDDNSPDKTGRVAEGMKKHYRIKVIHRSFKLGLSSAVLEGFKVAEGGIIGVMDADLSHPPEIIPDLIEPLFKGEADLVVGSRYVNGGGVKNWSLRRKITSKLAASLAKGLTDVRDPMSGFFFFDRGIIKSVELNPRGYKIGLEIMVKGRYKSIKEVPYVFAERKSGKSKLGFGEKFEYLLHLLRLYLYKMRV